MNGYGSRKFMITSVTLIATMALAYFGKMDGDVAFVFAAAITSYNVANAWIKRNGNGHTD